MESTSLMLRARALADPVAYTLGIKGHPKIHRRFSCGFETVAL
jgi:hypothetical protein